MLDLWSAAPRDDAESKPSAPKILAAVPALNEEVARLAGAHVIRHPFNLGKGAAMRSAMLYTRDNHTDVLVLHDADGQHNTEEIPELVAPILEDKADVAIGVRWGKETGMPMYRRVEKRVLDYATAMGSKNGTVTDSQCGFRAFSRKAFNMVDVSQRGIAVESEMLINCHENGLRVVEVPISCRYDVKGSTFKPGRHDMGVLGGTCFDSIGKEAIVLLWSLRLTARLRGGPPRNLHRQPVLQLGDIRCGVRLPIPPLRNHRRAVNLRCLRPQLHEEDGGAALGLAVTETGSMG
jgi:hypothetical protein